MNAMPFLAMQALLGTDKRPPELPVDDDAVGTLMRDLAAAKDDSGNGDALRLLRAAGAQAVCGLAGHLPPRTESFAPPLCPPETRRIVDDEGIIDLLRQLFTDSAVGQCAEALRLMKRAGRVLPPALLPQALAFGRRITTLREPVAAVAGERGRWLGTQNPAWNLFATDAEGALDPEVWEHGAPAQRNAYLNGVRRQDPAKGRALFEEALGSSDAKERADFAECLEEGLSLEDEPFLETLLAKDRSKEVRRIAALLLSCLPESGYARRMSERLAACVALPDRRKGLLGRVAGALSGPALPEIIPPETFDPAWKKDMLEEKKPQYEQLGQRGWWLYQIARTTPLSWWERHTGLTPKELIEWSQQGDWTLALLRAWREGIRRENDPRWAKAFLDRLSGDRMPGVTGNLPFDVLGLIAVLPLAEREAAVLDRFPYPGTLDSPARFAAENAEKLTAFAYVAAIPWGEGAVFSEEGGRKLLARVHFWAKYLTEDGLTGFYGAGGVLYRIAGSLLRLLPASLKDKAMEDWPRDAEGLPCNPSVYTRLAAADNVRKTLYHYFAGENAS